MLGHFKGQGPHVRISVICVTLLAWPCGVKYRAYPLSEGYVSLSDLYVLCCTDMHTRIIISVVKLDCLVDQNHFIQGCLSCTLLRLK